MKLTSDMQSALELLGFHDDQALVRTRSQWWVPESRTEAAQPTAPPQDDARCRRLYLGDGHERVPVVRTATVKALAARKLLRFTGGTRQVLSGANRVDYWRAEITPAGLSLRAQQVQCPAEATVRTRVEVGGSI